MWILSNPDSVPLLAVDYPDKQRFRGRDTNKQDEIGSFANKRLPASFHTSKNSRTLHLKTL